MYITDVANLEVTNRLVRGVHGNWMCTDCNFSKDRKLAVVGHIQASHIPNFEGYYCDLCNNKSKTILAYQRHLQRLHGGLNKINQDALQFWFILELVHIEAKMVKIAKGWKCLDCEYEHMRKDLLFSHVQANHVDFPGYSCNICGKLSKTWVALNKHRTRNHKNYDNV